MAGPKPTPLSERFNTKYVVDEATGCWEWQAYKMPNGYGQIGFPPRRMALAHRVSFELHNGPIPKGLHVLHTCDNRGCVNPEHLFLGTHQDNMGDMVAKARHSHGEAQWNVILTESQAKAVIALCKRHPRRRKGQSGYGLLTFLGNWFGVSNLVISEIAQGRSWGHLQ